MVKAGALYFAILVAFFIAVVSASLILLAAHYRNAYLKEIRQTRLLSNLDAGLTYVLADHELDHVQTVVDLYGAGSDSLAISKSQWGIFDLAVLQTFIKQDTVKKILLIGKETDATVLYLSDEDRPLSVSGETQIIGDATLPKSGVRKAYAEGRPYTREKTVDGQTTNSERTLTSLDQGMLYRLKDEFKAHQRHLQKFTNQSVIHSFLHETLRFRLPKVAALTDISLRGNIILYSDSLVSIGASAKLDGLQIYAPKIKVESGFKGNCQLYATDSITVGRGASFSYPSVLAVLKQKDGAEPKGVFIDANATVNGIIFTHESNRSPLQTTVRIGKKAVIKGEVYCTGILSLETDVQIAGKVSCNRFLMKTATALYENFLIDVTLNRKARSPFYLSSRLFDTRKENKILRWLN